MVPRVKIRTVPHPASSFGAGSTIAAHSPSNVSAISSSLRPRVIQGTPAIASSLASPQVRPRPLKTSLQAVSPLAEPSSETEHALPKEQSHLVPPSINQSEALREAAQAFIDLHQHLLVQSKTSTVSVSPSTPENPLASSSEVPVLTEVVEVPRDGLESKNPVQGISASSLMAKSFELLFNRYIDSHQNWVIKPLSFLLAHRGVLSLAFLHIFMPFIMMYALVHWSAPLYYFFFFPTALDQWMKWVVLYISCFFTWSLSFVTACSVGEFFINREVDRRIQERRRLLALRKKQKNAASLST